MQKIRFDRGETHFRVAPPRACIWNEGLSMRTLNQWENSCHQKSAHTAAPMGPNDYSTPDGSKHKRCRGKKPFSWLFASVEKGPLLLDCWESQSLIWFMFKISTLKHKVDMCGTGHNSDRQTVHL